MALGVGIERSRPARAAEQRVKAASLAARGPSFG